MANKKLFEVDFQGSTWEYRGIHPFLLMALLTFLKVLFHFFVSIYVRRDYLTLPESHAKFHPTWMKFALNIFAFE